MHSREHSYDSKSLSMFALSLGGLLQLFVSVLNVKIFMMVAKIIILYAEWNFSALVIFSRYVKWFIKKYWREIMASKSILAISPLQIIRRILKGRIWTHNFYLFFLICNRKEFGTFQLSKKFMFFCWAAPSSSLDRSIEYVCIINKIKALC